MDNDLYGLSRQNGKFLSYFCFTCVWCFGFLFGIFAGSSVKPSILALMRWDINRPMSIVGLLSILCLPYLLTGFAVLYRIPRFIFFVSFLKSFLLGFCCAVLKVTFTEVHWIYKSLLLFTDYFSLLIITVLWLRCFDNACRVRHIITGFLLSLCIGVFDYMFISPFMASVIEKG